MYAESSPVRRRFTALAVAVCTSFAALLGASPALAAPPPPVEKYVALGDSYAAGQGAGSYLDSCLRSPDGYAGQLDDVPRYSLLRQPACSGATIADVMATQLPEVNRGTTLVTVTAGGNDLDAAGVYAFCVEVGVESNACRLAAFAALARVDAVGPNMVELITAIQKRSPDATIVVTGYPVPFESALEATSELVTLVNTGTQALNLRLFQAVQATAAQGADVVFAPVPFDGHAIGSADPWLGADITDGVTFMHPTIPGYTRYRDAILTSLG